MEDGCTSRRIPGIKSVVTSTVSEFREEVDDVATGARHLTAEVHSEVEAPEPRPQLPSGKVLYDPLPTRLEAAIGWLDP